MLMLCYVFKRIGDHGIDDRRSRECVAYSCSLVADADDRVAKEDDVTGDRKSIQAAAQAALWVISNGKCYAPGCLFPVIVEVRPGVYKKNAQIAHIYGGSAALSTRHVRGDGRAHVSATARHAWLLLERIVFGVIAGPQRQSRATICIGPATRRLGQGSLTR